jgi:ligand-binding sensor domain-containing protein/signal transduction histidine kinase
MDNPRDLKIAHLRYEPVVQVGGVSPLRAVWPWLCRGAHRVTGPTFRFMESHWIVGFVCCVLLFNEPASANSGGEYVVANWSVEQGLPQHTVKAIRQTKDGFLWVGTYNGLARFDGLRFTTFNTANTPAMRSEDITWLEEDRQGRLWIGTDHGLVRYEKGQFFTAGEAQAFRDAYITKIIELPDGTLLVATDQGIFKRTAGKFLEIPIPNASWPTRHSLHAVDPSGNLWLSHRSDLYAWKDEQVQWHARLPGEIGILFADYSGTLWCGLHTGAISRVTKGGVEEFSQLQELRKQDLYQTRNGDIWIATQQGVIRERHGIMLQISKKDGLPTDIIKTLYEDREGNIWLGTSGSGLVRLREKLLETHSTQNGLSSDDAITILEDRQRRIWLGTFEGGLSRFENGRWTPHKPPEFPAHVRDVISLCQTRDGAIWFGSYGRGAFRLDGSGIQHVITNETVIRAIFEDKEGGLWFGSSKFGVEHLKGQTVAHYNTENGLSLNFITAIAQDRSGDIWVGTENGLNRIAGGKVARFFKEDGLGANLVNALLTDQSGTVWIGTSGGLSRYKNGSLATVTTTQGLAQDVVTQIVEDDNGNLWMGSRSGIFRARKQNLNEVMDGLNGHVHCVSYTKADGLPSLSFVPGFQPTCMKASDGRLWFCGPRGVVVIDPKRMLRNELPRPVFIESLLVDGEDMFGPAQRARRQHSELERSGAELQERDSIPLKIQPGARRLEFQYTSLDFSSPEQVQFRCKLEGYDEDWQFVGTRRTAYYTRVPPGQYRFRVAVALGEAKEDEHQASIALILQPHFRQTWWFRPLLFTFSAAILVSFYRLRTRHVREVEQMRWRIASDLHDEVGSNLSNIALLAHLAKAEQKNSSTPQTELAEINRVALATANSVRDLVWFINPECDTLGELTRQMEATARQTLPLAVVDFESEVRIPSRQLSLQFRRHLFFFFKEALHNVLKHAQARHIRIHFRERDGLLDLSIGDDGVGYDAASVKRGHGLNGMRRRAVDLDGTLTMESRSGEGTQIVLKVRLR